MCIPDEENTDPKQKGPRSGGSPSAISAHNFIRIHRTLRMPPAMAAGVVYRLLSVETSGALREGYESRRAERAVA